MSRFVSQGAANHDGGSWVDVEFAYSFPEFGGAYLFSSDVQHLLVVQVLQNFCNQASDGFNVVLVRVEGFSEELVNPIFRLSKVGGDCCQNVPSNYFFHR